MMPERWVILELTQEEHGRVLYRAEHRVSDTPAAVAAATSVLARFIQGGPPARYRLSVVVR